MACNKIGQLTLSWGDWGENKSKKQEIDLHTGRKRKNTVFSHSQNFDCIEMKMLSDASRMGKFLSKVNNKPSHLNIYMSIACWT